MAKVILILTTALRMCLEITPDAQCKADMDACFKGCHTEECAIACTSSVLKYWTRKEDLRNQEFKND